MTESAELPLQTVCSTEQARELDALLWEVLWRPIGLPRDFRKLISAGLVETELVALDGGAVVAGAVLAHYDDRMEIRHLAVSQPYQRQGLGRRLVQLAVDLAPEGQPVETWARNTSLGFFDKLGFSVGEDAWREAEVFCDHDIRFRRMRRLP